MKGLIALAAFALLCGLAAPAAAKPQWRSWPARPHDARTYQISGLTFELRTRPGKASGPVPVLRITAKGKPPVVVVGAEGPSSVTASFIVLPAIGDDAGPIILFRSFTGGAHCCDDYRLVEAGKAGWRVRALGMWDGSGPEPEDVDHDGRLELVAGDQRFNYRLTSHAGSLLPPVILSLKRGVLVDISSQPRFRAYFRARLADAQEACRGWQQTDIGPCLGYVAIAARAGQAREALAMLDARAVADDASFEVPVRCGSPPSPVSCRTEQPTKTFANRHDAVVWFLTDLGYLPTAST